MQSCWAIGYGAAAIVTAIVLPRFGWRAVFLVGVLPGAVHAVDSSQGARAGDVAAHARERGTLTTARGDRPSRRSTSRRHDRLT